MAAEELAVEWKLVFLSFWIRPDFLLLGSWLVGLLTSQGNTVLNITNLARADPKELTVAQPPGFKTSFLMYKVNNTPALCYTFGLSVADWTQNPQPSGICAEGKLAKMFSLVPQALEINRKVAVLCEAAKLVRYWAPLLGNILTFQTRAGIIGEESKF